jgi:hypothetical protein
MPVFVGALETNSKITYGYVHHFDTKVGATLFKKIYKLYNTKDIALEIITSEVLSDSTYL